MSIKIFRMLSGDEIIATVSQETDTTFTLANPRAVIFQQEQTAANEPPTMRVSFFPLSYVRQTKDEVVIFKTAIFGVMENLEQPFIDGYTQHVSGIQIVRAL